MPKFICSGAKLKCMIGDSNSELIVLHPVELVYLRCNACGDKQTKIPVYAY